MESFCVISASLYLYLGADKYDKCPINTDIPIFLIVFGIAFIIHTVLYFVGACAKCCTKVSPCVAIFSCCTSCFQFILFILEVIWFGVGSYWVFTAWGTWMGPQCKQNNAKFCCDPLLIKFAFGSLLAIYGVAVLFVLFCCAMICCLICTSSCAQKNKYVSISK